jgi:hypothetical protein
MLHLLAAAWLLQKTLFYAGLAVAWAGVATFGWYFVSLNALAAQGETDEIPSESWRGRGAQIGMWIFGSGIVLMVGSMVLWDILPNSY